MTATDFRKRIAALHCTGRQVEAARSVLVDGTAISAAARDSGLTGPMAVSRLVRRIVDLELCPTCGRPR